MQGRLISPDLPRSRLISGHGAPLVQGRRPRDGPQGRAVVAQEVQRLTQAQEGAAAEPTPCHGSLTSSDPLGSSHPLTLALHLPSPWHFFPWHRWPWESSRSRRWRKRCRGSTSNRARRRGARGGAFERGGGRERERDARGVTGVWGPKAGWPRVARRPVRARRAEPASPHDL